MSQELNKEQADDVINGPLYHYTDAKGLLGIIENKKIWATHIRYLNDTREFSHSIELAERILADRDFPGADELGEDDLSKLGYFTGHTAKYDSFVASFSEQHDDLSQWRAYSRNGAGFNIRFQPDLLDLKAQEGLTRLYRCIYCEEEQECELRGIYSRAASRLRDAQCDEGQGHVLAEFAAEFLRKAATLKHPAFEPEKEWRLATVVFPDDSAGVECRPGPSMLVPYIEIDLASSDEGECPISGVCIGPSAHQELSAQAIKRYLDSHGLPDVDVGQSKIPFRNW